MSAGPDGRAESLFVGAEVRCDVGAKAEETLGTFGRRLICCDNLICVDGWLIQLG